MSADPAITYPEPTGERVEARVDITEQFYTCSLPAPTREHPHRIVVARVRAFRDLLGGQWYIEVAEGTKDKVRDAFPTILYSEQVHPDMVATYATRLAQRIVHVLWLHDRREHLAREVADDWRSADLDMQATNGSSEAPR